MIKRTKYIERIRPFYDSDLIKVLTGIRRCGKSVILKQICDEIKKNPKVSEDNIISINFEDTYELEKFPDAKSLCDYVLKTSDIKSNQSSKKMKYVFLDEVQLVKDWPSAVKTLRLHDCSVFITGSNSKLLSSEFKLELSGRFVSFQIRPFIYKEITEYSNELKKNYSIEDYLIWGGFPASIALERDAKIDYLKALNDTIIFKDILTRNSIANSQLFTAVTDFVLQSNSRIVSSSSIYKAVKQQVDCSDKTISKYLQFLEAAYVICPLQQYSTRTKQNLRFFQKSYNMDVSFNSLRAPKGRYDLTHNMENIVYLELLYMGYELKVYNGGSYEVDFMASKGSMIYYIQVAYSIADEKTYNREMSALAAISDNLSQKILITTDKVDYSTSLVRHISLEDFLMMDSLG